MKLSPSITEVRIINSMIFSVFKISGFRNLIVKINKNINAKISVSILNKE